MKARDVMRRDLASVTVHAGLSAAYGIMEDLGVHHLPIVDHGHVIGMLSDRDLMRYARFKPQDETPVFGGITVGSVDFPAAVVVSPTTSVTEVADRMLTEHVDSVSVVDSEHHLVGIVTSTDLVRVVREDEPEFGEDD